MGRVTERIKAARKIASNSRLNARIQRSAEHHQEDADNGGAIGGAASNTPHKSNDPDRNDSLLRRKQSVQNHDSVRELQSTRRNFQVLDDAVSEGVRKRKIEDSSLSDEFDPEWKNTLIPYKPKQHKRARKQDSSEVCELFKVPDDSLLSKDEREIVRLINTGTNRKGDWKARLEQVRNRPLVAVRVRSVDQQRFSSWGEVTLHWAAYEAETFTCYRTRTSETREHAISKKGKSIPPEFEYYEKHFWCTHGCTQGSRSSGIQLALKTRYTGCPARATIRVVFLKDKSNWEIRVVKQISLHNHHVNPSIYSTYFNNTTINDDILLGKLDAMFVAGTSNSAVASYLSGTHGIDINTQQVKNLRAARLGGATCIARTKRLIGRFLAIPGNHFAVLRDQAGMTVGFIFQSKIQAVLFERWPETVVLDWTYNTNNRGLHVGALVITGPTGRGIPIFEFFSVSESSISLTTILSYFKETNHVWQKIEAFVIDKSFAELKTLQDLFPRTVTFLCQFHVMQAVERALKKPKYRLSHEVMEEVKTAFASLVYASSQASYDERLVRFRRLTSSVSTCLAEYFEVNWLSIYFTWSNVGRAMHFSCGNTTTNRIESNWSQIKKMGGERKAIDACLRCLFRHQVAVLKDQRTQLAQFLTRSQVLENTPVGLQEIVGVLADWPFRKVFAQWNSYVAGRVDWKVGISVSKDDIAVCTTHETHCVNTSHWTCSCYFYVSLRLPCKHMMFVSINVMEYRQLPMESVAPRWRMLEASSVIPDLAAGIESLSPLTVHSWEPANNHMVLRTTIQHGIHGTTSEVSAKKSKIRYLSVRRPVDGNKIVLSHLEKRNIMRDETTELTQRLMQFSSRKFHQCLSEYREVVAVLLQKWSDGNIRGAPNEVKSAVKDDETSSMDEWDDDIVDTNPVDVFSNNESDCEDSEEDGHVLRGFTSGAVCTEGAAVENKCDRQVRDGCCEGGGRDISTECEDFLDDDVKDEVQKTLSGVVDLVVASTAAIQALDPTDDIHTRKHVATEELNSLDFFDFDFWFENVPDEAVEELCDPVVAVRDTRVTGVIPAVGEPNTFGVGCGELASEQDEQHHEKTDVFVVEDRQQLSMHSLATILNPADDGASTIVATEHRERNITTDVRTKTMSDMEPSPTRRLDQMKNNSLAVLDLLPAPIPGRARMKKGKLLVISSETEGIDVKIGQFNKWAMQTKNLRAAFDALKIYPEERPVGRFPIVGKRLVELASTRHAFRIPFKIAEAINAKIVEEEDRAREGGGTRGPVVIELDAKITESESDEEEARGEVVAWFPRKPTLYTKSYITHVIRHHHLRLTASRWADDLQWLKQVRPKTSNIFDKAFRDQCFGNHQTSIRNIIDNVKSRVECTPFSSRFRTYRCPLNHPIEVTFEDVIGKLADQSWLSDRVIFFALNRIVQGRRDVFIIDPNAPPNSSLKPPQTPLPTITHLIHPVNLSNSHWVVLIVQFRWGMVGDVTYVRMYDPYVSSSTIKWMSNIWSERTLPFIKTWLHRDYSETGGSIVHIGNIVEVVEPTPRQRDSASCGVLCIAVVNSYVNAVNINQALLNDDAVASGDLDALRLRLLHLILVDSIKLPPTCNPTAHSLVDARVNKFLATQKRK